MSLAVYSSEDSNDDLLLVAAIKNFMFYHGSVPYLDDYGKGRRHLILNIICDVISILVFLVMGSSVRDVVLIHVLGFSYRCTQLEQLGICLCDVL